MCMVITSKFEVVSKIKVIKTTVTAHPASCLSVSVFLGYVHCVFLKNWVGVKRTHVTLNLWVLGPHATSRGKRLRVSYVAYNLSKMERAHNVLTFSMRWPCRCTGAVVPRASHVRCSYSPARCKRVQQRSLFCSLCVVSAVVGRTQQSTYLLGKVRMSSGRFLDSWTEEVPSNHVLRTDHTRTTYFFMHGRLSQCQWELKN